MLCPSCGSEITTLWGAMRRCGECGAPLFPVEGAPLDPARPSSPRAVSAGRAAEAAIDLTNRHRVDANTSAQLDRIMLLLEDIIENQDARITALNELLGAPHPPAPPGALADRIGERRGQHSGQVALKACPYCQALVSIDPELIAVDRAGPAQACGQCGGRVPVRVADRHRTVLR